jgi:hypothetical protein
VKKHLETFLKGFQHPKDQLSAVPPDQYAERFVKFIKSSIKTKEDLSHTAIPEESPIATPSNEKTLVPRKSEDGVDIVRTLVQSPDRPEQPLPAITIQHPSPEIKDNEFEKLSPTIRQKPLSNGWADGLFGDKVVINANSANGNGVGKELVV